MRLKWNILNGIKLFEWIVHCFRVEIFSENPFSKTICLSNFFSWCRKKVEALTTVVRWSVSILFKIHGILYYISRGLNLFSRDLDSTTSSVFAFGSGWGNKNIKICIILFWETFELSNVQISFSILLHPWVSASTILIEIVWESCCEFWTDFLKGMNKIPYGRFWMNRFLKTFWNVYWNRKLFFGFSENPFLRRYVFLIFQSLQEKVEALATV